MTAYINHLVKQYNRYSNKSNIASRRHKFSLCELYNKKAINIQSIANKLEEAERNAFYNAIVFFNDNYYPSHQSVKGIHWKRETKYNN